MSQISIQLQNRQKNKDRLDIIACVLKTIATKGQMIKNITQIHRYIGVSSRHGGITSLQAKRYLLEMQELDLISVLFPGNGQYATKISVTSKGWGFLHLYSQMRNLLDCSENTDTSLIV